MRKIVINGCYGGFGLSHKATMRYAELKGIQLYPFSLDEGIRNPKPWDGTGDEPFFVSYRTTNDLEDKDNYFDKYDISRADPVLVQIVEEMGKDASGRHSNLEIVEIPDDVKWCIAEYDGNKYVAEQHRTWHGKGDE